MKGRGIILLTILLVGISTIIYLTKGDERQMKRAAVGIEAPDFEINDIEGKAWRLSELRGKVVMLNFWATWCDTCKEENPTIQNLLNLEKSNNNLVIITVLFKDTMSNAAAYMKKNNFTYPVLIDDKDIAKTYGVTGVPETFIIDKKGIIRDKVIGPNTWDSRDVRLALARLAQGDAQSNK
ncbi:MAG: TlpA family protein disulfide reductase [Nitrospirae bacterium]|nr:TlpA family protein disulfide reductase [Nitrospirota bacterium]